MTFQPSLFASAPCPLHSIEYVCDQCPEDFDTDGSGWVHPRLRKGRVALRTCRSCKQQKPKPDWSESNWFVCRACEGKA